MRESLISLCSQFWHCHLCFNIKKPIQLRFKLLKTKKYQIDDFIKYCSARIIVEILEKTNNSLYKKNISHFKFSSQALKCIELTPP